MTSPIQSYSCYVSIMRKALPLLAVVLALLLVVWPALKHDPRDLPPSSMGQREMTNLHYVGQNARGEPLDVIAARAIQVGKLEDVIDITEIKATLTRQSGSAVTITADTGRYDQSKNHMTLTSNVHILDADGYDLTTEKAEIDLATPAQAWGERPVSGTGPQGRKINAGGFRVTDAGQTVIFTGRSRIDLGGKTP